MAFSCSYSGLLDKASSCGLSSDYPGQLECVALKECTKDVTGHLATFKLSSDEGVGNEMKLLLARAGKSLSIRKMSCVILCIHLHCGKVLYCTKLQKIIFRGFLSGRTTPCPEHLPTS